MTTKEKDRINIGMLGAGCIVRVFNTFVRTDFQSGNSSRAIDT